RTQRVRGLAVAQLPADPEAGHDLVPRTATTPVVDEREPLAEEARREEDACAQGEAIPLLSIDRGADAEVAARDDRQRDRRPGEEAPPRPRRRRERGGEHARRNVVAA